MKKLDQGMDKIIAMFDDWFKQGYLKIAVWVLIAGTSFLLFLFLFNLLFKFLYPN